MTVVEPRPAASDADLLAASRAGDDAAYGVLWTRHAAAGRTAARGFVPPSEVDDLVAEAYARILAAMRRGNGPTDAFRPYLYRVMRNIAAEGTPSPAVSTDELEALPDPFAPAAEDAMERDITVAAFRSLPPRWRQVLWYTDVEDLRPRELAAVFGTSAHAVAALAHRAREGLRTAWIQAHLSDRGRPEECRRTIAELGRYARDELRGPARAAVEAHLKTCEDCSGIALEARSVASRLRATVGVIVLGTGAAGLIGSLAAVSGAAPTAVAAAPQAGPGGVVRHLVARLRSAPRSVTVAASGAGAVLVAAGVAFAVVAASSAPPEPPVAAPEAAPVVAQDPASGDSAPVEPADPPAPVETAAPEAPAAPAVPEKPSAPRRPAAPPAPVDPVPSDPQPTDPEPSDPEPSDPGPAVLTSPVVTSAIDVDAAAPPSLSGTGQPGATVEVRGSDGTLLASVVVGADGNWGVGELSALSPLETSLAVTQTVDGVASEPTVLGPFAFVPTIVLDPEEQVLSGEDDDVLIVLGGWPGAHVYLTWQNLDYPWLQGRSEPVSATYAGGVGGSAFWTPGHYTLTARYTDDSGEAGIESAPVHFTRE